jgi:hypothetical protein
LLRRTMRRAIIRIGCGARVFIALFLLLASANAASTKPNIVVILTDDQEDTGSMAYMPKLHSLLAEHGLTFTIASSISHCAPPAERPF